MHTQPLSILSATSAHADEVAGESIQGAIHPHNFLNAYHTPHIHLQYVFVLYMYIPPAADIRSILQIQIGAYISCCTMQ